MKAVIMAGGEGSRLRPLTCGRPKPMVPVMNKPVMSHIIELLKIHGLKNIGVTLQYMPEAISDFFGNGSEYDVNMKYFIEDVPLGTAGSVKNARDFLDETFIVISGDALTDFDLTRAVEFHREKGAAATLVLTRVDTPLEYGVVITEEDGHVRRFLEKPSWGEVFSDTVNTGIYVLEPEILDYFEFGQKYDFSQDLFPLLLKKNEPVYGVVLPGYWCDIGNLNQYLEAHYDVFCGKVKVDTGVKEISPGVWAGKDVQISPSAKIQGPALIGKGTRLGKDVFIEPFTVIGENCSIAENASIKRSVTWNNVTAGPSVSVRGAVLCSRVQLQSNSCVYEGAVVGSDCQLGERSIIKPGVKLWPQKTVDNGTVVQESIIWGRRHPKRLFGLEGVSGTVNSELTPEFTAKLCAVYASISGRGSKIGISCDSYIASSMLKKAAIIGVQSAGAVPFDLGTIIMPGHRFAVRKYDCSAGVHIKMSSREKGGIDIIFTGETGGNISRNKERKIENTLAREDFTRVEPGQLEQVTKSQNVFEEYLDSITQNINKKTVNDINFKVVIAGDNSNLNSYVQKLVRQLNLQVEFIDIPGGPHYPQYWRGVGDMIPGIARDVVEKGASLGLVMDQNADRFILVSDKGDIIKEDLLTSLLSLVVLKLKGGPVIVPVTAPASVDLLARKYSVKVVRTKTAVQDFSEQLIKAGAFSQFLMNFDALAAFVMLLDFMAANNLTVSELLEEIPEFYIDKREIQVPWEIKGRVIRQLIEENPSEEMELLDGIKAFHPEGWTLVLPDPEEPLCRIFSEGVTMEVAESLADFYSDKINDIIGEGKAG